MTELVIDANGLIAGRLAAFCAKKALTGNKVDVINVEKAVISGNSKMIVKVFKKRRQMTEHANPENAAKWPRRPDLLFKRMLWGMLPRGQRGRDAAKKVKMYMGNREVVNTMKPPVKDVSKLKGRFISLRDLCKELGWSARNE